MDAKFDAFYSLVENMSDGDLLIIYNQMADENGYERIMLMEEFNDIQFSTNLELADSLANGFNVNHNYFYCNDSYGTYHSCETVSEAVDEISSLNELTHYLMENYSSCIKRLDVDLSDEIREAFIDYAINYSNIPYGYDWFNNKMDFYSPVEEDWDDYLFELEKQYQEEEKEIEEQCNK